MENRKIEVKVYGMLSAASERKIEEKLLELNGISSVMASFEQGVVAVEYDAECCSVKKIESLLVSSGYHLKNPKVLRNIIIASAAAAVLLAIVLINPVKLIKNRGTSTQSKNTINIVKPEIKDGKQIIKMTVDSKKYSPNVFYVQKNKPVKWMINVKEIDDCNNELVVPAYRIRQKLKLGENVIEFIPSNNNDVNFSCSTGVMAGVIKVVNDINNVPSEKTSAVNTPKTDASPAAHVHGSGDDDGCDDILQQPGGSLYGKDLSNVPTDKLVKRAQVIDEVQTLSINGVGGEFDPPVIVVNKTYKVRLAIDFNLFEYPQGNFSILDYNTKAVLTKFQASKTNNILFFEYAFKKSGTYVINKDNKNLTIVVVVDDVKNADLEQIRAKYVK